MIMWMLKQLETLVRSFDTHCSMAPDRVFFCLFFFSG